MPEAAASRPPRRGRSLAYLERLLLLPVHRAHAAERWDELEGDQRPVRLLPDPALGEHASHHLDDVSLREAVGDLRQATHVQGIRHDPAVALNDLLPQNCRIETAGKAQGARVTAGKPALPRVPARGRESPGGACVDARSELPAVRMGRSRGTKCFPERAFTARRTCEAPASADPRVPREWQGEGYAAASPVSMRRLRKCPELGLRSGVYGILLIRMFSRVWVNRIMTFLKIRC